MSFNIRPGHIFIDLIENAPFNIGKNKVYEGVPGNLIAFACKASFTNGCEGFVSFIAKTKLIAHYEKSLGAHHVGRQRMVIDTHVAQQLIDKYFKT